MTDAEEPDSSEARGLAESWFIAGPTAVGKSEVALQLAEQLGGEIISVDSMQVYQGLDIGTAKPGTTLRARIPHHLIDVATLAESFDAARFVQLARQARAEIRSRGRVPVFCGGTGLYFKALLEGLGDAPPADGQLRTQLEATSLPDLLRELAERDPETFTAIDQQNRRRIVRAIEVIRLTGRKFSAQRAAWNVASKTAVAPQRFYCLTRATPELHARIDARVEEMFTAGLVAETHELLRRGLKQNRTAMQALGYRQVVEYLHGARGLPETIELVKMRTRQYARRQLTWFRKYAPAKFVDLSSVAGREGWLRQAIAAQIR